MPRACTKRYSACNSCCFVAPLRTVAVSARLAAARAAKTVAALAGVVAVAYSFPCWEVRASLDPCGYVTSPKDAG